jgi:hypothetical protein
MGMGLTSPSDFSKEIISHGSRNCACKTGTVVSLVYMLARAKSLTTTLTPLVTLRAPLDAAKKSFTTIIRPSLF